MAKTQGKTYEVQGKVKMKEKIVDAEEKATLGEDVAKSSKGTNSRNSERYEDFSSDSDTDECYEPLGMEAWRWATPCGKPGSMCF